MGLLAAVCDLGGQFPNFLKPLLAFFGVLPSFFSQLPFGCFSSSSFSGKHNVAPNTPESPGYASVGKHFVQQVNVNVPALTRRATLIGYLVSARFCGLTPYYPSYDDRHGSKREGNTGQFPKVCQKAWLAIIRFLV